MALCYVPRIYGYLTKYVETELRKSDFSTMHVLNTYNVHNNDDTKATPKVSNIDMKNGNLANLVQWSMPPKFDMHVVPSCLLRQIPYYIKLLCCKDTHCLTH